jgi:hypothetical protein
MLTGSELLATVEAMGRVSKSEIVRHCGYVTTKADGRDRLHYTAFYAALLEAKGVNFYDDRQGSGKVGRPLTYTTKVHFHGAVMVGKAYMKMLGLKAGDLVAIRLGPKQIYLEPVEPQV